MLVDYHIHGVGHADRPHTFEQMAPFVERAVQMELKEIGFAEHDSYLEELDMAVFECLQKEFPQVKIRVGLEVDHFPEKKVALAEKISSYQFDYLIGSVHFIDDWPFDHPDYLDGYCNWQIDELYQAYFSRVLDAVNSGLYSIVGHLDLIKVFGFKPSVDIIPLVIPVLRAIKRANLVVEVNTNGLFKPVGEVYPAPEILHNCYQYGIPVTLSSDAHSPENVGRKLKWAAGLLRQVGYTQIATFEQKVLSFVAL